jgi:Na+/H+ antiporter NhaD/arsenite permease-like protein
MQNWHLICAVAVFVGGYAWLATEKTPRYVVALCGASILVLARVFMLEEALAQVNWDTIALIFGMFTIVAALSESGFFNWLALALARGLKYDPVRVFFFFPLLAAVLSMFLDNITVMVFLTTLTLELCTHIPVNPVVLITAEVCAANTGGGATLMGAPPNIVMGTTLGYGFNAFLTHMGLPVAICTAVLLAAYYVIHRKDLNKPQRIDRVELDAVDLRSKIKDPALMQAGLATLAAVVLLLVIQRRLESTWHLTFTVGMAALVPALVLMVGMDRHGRDVLRKVDVESILFFIGLFVMVGALDKVGVFKLLNRFVLDRVSHPLVLAIAFLWFGAFTSALVDNIPMALSMAYLIKDMRGLPGAAPEGLIVWASLLGLLMGGNMTPIGASPNVVAYGILERSRLSVGWKRWIILTTPPTLIALLVASLLIALKFKLGWY